jgi:hypothetical protein
MTGYGVIYSRANVSPVARRRNTRRRVSSSASNAAYWAENLYIPTGTADLWRSARRFGR